MSGEYLDLARAQAAPLSLGALLVGAALAAALPHARASWVVAVFAALASAWAAVSFATQALWAAGPIIDAGPLLTIDGVGAFAAPMIVSAVVAVMFAAGALMERRRTAPFSMALALCAAAGWVGALLATDLLGVAAGAEAAWLASIGLIALGGERGALNGALRMLFTGGVSAMLVLIGVSMIGRAAGSMDVAAIAGAETPTVAAAGVMLVFVSLSLKAGLAPLHVWTGASLGRTDSFAALFVGTVGIVGALAVATRVSVHAASAPLIAGGVGAAIAALGVVAVVVGSAQAVGATNLRRLAGYALASQAGCVLLSLSLGSPAGFASALVQLFALAAAALALFTGAAVVREPALEALDGLGRRAPLASAALTAGALSLMGAPLTIGFLGRWRLIEAAVGAGWWWMAGVTLLASLAAVFYGGRLIERIYFRRDTNVRPASGDPWRYALAPALLAAIGAIALGFDPSIVLEAAGNASSLLFGFGP